jgi:hypothetical protein
MGRNRVIGVMDEIYFWGFWASLILGHIFFIIVLKKSLAKDAVTREEHENINLLDDVLN